MHETREREREREREMSRSREEAIVIVGGGICGLATALALHKKGLRSTVLERSESVPSTGAGILIYTNGWRALDQLGVGPLLRQKCIPILLSEDISCDNGERNEFSFGETELRCLKRSDLLKALADALPPQTIHFDHRVINVMKDSASPYRILDLQDGSTIKAKVLIGCDGVNSIVAESLGLKTSKLFSITVARGLSYYPEGHPLGQRFLRYRKRNIVVGRIPIDHNWHHWYISRPWTPQDSEALKDPELLKEAMVDSVKDFPGEIIEMVKMGELESLNLTRLRYRSPWELLVGSFSEGTVTVAGDAMHVVGPFLGQGGSSGMEDAVVLARCLARAIDERDGSRLKQEISLALQSYVKERRKRVLRLATQSYLVGAMTESSSASLKILVPIVLKAVFGHRLSHTEYDCGRLDSTEAISRL